MTTVPDYVTDEAMLLSEVLTEVRAIATDVAKIRERMDSTEAMISGVVAEVKPTIDELMNSSLGKMLRIGKK